MFRRCTGLTQAPALPATTLTDHCYDCMFEGCTGLTQVPALPATTLAPYCYGAMFWGCTGLTWVPKLSATALADYCYSGMLRDCAGISLHAQGPGTERSIPSAAVPATGWHNGMFAGTSGTFTGNPVIGVVYYCTSGSGPGPDPDDPEAPNIVAITVDPGASTLAITIDNAITGAWYTLLGGRAWRSLCGQPGRPGDGGRHSYLPERARDAAAPLLQGEGQRDPAVAASDYNERQITNKG